jgi:hypothetical protein
MIDMTNNRVPYRLLTDEEWDALRAHKEAGGVVEHYCEGVWSKCGPSWSTEGIYRTVPLPKTQDVIAWDRLPDWVEWVARDMNGKVYCSEVYPGAGVPTWLYSKHILCRRIDDFPGIVQIGTCDWKDSKQRRPRG